MQRKTFGIILGTAAVIIGAVVATNQAAVRETSAQLDATTIKGDLSVSYQVRLADGGSGSVKAEACTAIEFRENYLVLRTKNGGQVLPVGQVSSFSWTAK